MIFIGIDAAKDKHDCFIVDSNGEVLFDVFTISNTLDAFKSIGDMPVEARLFTSTIENAQKKVEGKNFSIRKYVLQYDNVMNKQREIIYGERKRVLFGEDLREDVTSMTKQLIDEVVDPVVIASKFPEEWDFETINKGLKKITPDFKALTFTEEDFADMDEENLKARLYDNFEQIYQKKEEEIS